MCWILIPWQLQRVFSGFYSIWNLVGKNIFLLHAVCHKGIPDPLTLLRAHTASQRWPLDWFIGKRGFEILFFLPPVQRAEEVKKPQVFLPMICIVGKFSQHAHFQAVCIWVHHHLLQVCQVSQHPSTEPSTAISFCSFTTSLSCAELSASERETHIKISCIRHTNHLNITNIKMFLSSSSHRDFSPLSRYHVYRHIQKLPEIALSVF